MNDATKEPRESGRRAIIVIADVAALASLIKERDDYDPLLGSGKLLCDG